MWTDEPRIRGEFIVSLSLTRAMQLAIDIGAHLVSVRQLAAPGTMRETFEQLGQMGIILPGAGFTAQKVRRLQNNRDLTPAGKRP